MRFRARSNAAGRDVAIDLPPIADEDNPVAGRVSGIEFHLLVGNRDPGSVRKDALAVGAGFAYHVGAAVGSFTPTIIGALQDRGMPLGSAMAFTIALAGVLVIATVWMGPETRGRDFSVHS